VTEFARNFRKEDVRGRVVRVAPDGSRTNLGTGKLFAPTGAAVDASGAVYVSNFSVLPRKTPKKGPFDGAGGTLVKITP
jgi:sugar lactone lactonase YvrE